jgi:hypothetical protein
MMALTCQQAEELIEQLLEGTLSPRQEGVLKRHLGECARCRQRYEHERLALACLRALPPEEAPAGLVERVMDTLPTTSPELLGRLAGVLRRAQVDADLRRRLRENPYAALLSQHIALPPGLRVEIVSELPAPLPTSEVIYLPLPESPLELQEVEQRLAAMGLGPLFGFWW